MYRERDVWAGLKHPSIAPFYGYVEAGGIFGDFGALISQVGYSVVRFIFSNARSGMKMGMLVDI